MNRNLSQAQFHARFGSEYPSVGMLGRAYSKLGGMKAKPISAKQDREWWTVDPPQPPKAGLN